MGVLKKTDYKYFLSRILFFPITVIIFFSEILNLKATIKNLQNAAAEYKDLFFMLKDHQLLSMTSVSTDTLKAYVNEISLHNSKCINSKYPEV